MNISQHRSHQGARLCGVQTLALALAAIFAACMSGTPHRSWNGTPVEPATSAPHLVGVNWDGEPLDLAQLQDRVRIVFFGYTFCPDVCPFALAKMQQLYRALGPRADDVAVVFVSVDPKRDTVAKLSRYVPGFDRRFYGVRLAPDVLDRVADDFGITVRYGRPPDGGDGNRYFVDHTGTFFVIDRRGNLRLTFPPSARAGDLLPDIEALLEDAGGS